MLFRSEPSAQTWFGRSGRTTFGLTVRRGPNPGRAEVPNAVRSRRVHPRGAGNPSGAQAHAHVRSDQGPEFIAEAVKAWITGVGAKAAYIEKARPWESGYVESFNGKLRDELLNGEVFDTLREAQVLIGEWRQHYTRARPHSSLGYSPPAPETVPVAKPRIGSGAATTVIH